MHQSAALAFLNRTVYDIQKLEPHHMCGAFDVTTFHKTQLEICLETTNFVLLRTGRTLPNNVQALKDIMTDG